MNGAVPWRTVAIAALGLNVLTFGALVGGFAAGARFQPPATATETARGEARAALASLTPQERAALRRALAPVWRANAAARAERRAARRAVLEAANREPYDPAEMEAAFARMRAADAAVQAQVHGALATAMTDVSPESRLAALRLAVRRGGSERAE